MSQLRVKMLLQVQGEMEVDQANHIPITYTHPTNYVDMMGSISITLVAMYAIVKVRYTVLSNEHKNISWKTLRS